MLNRLRSRPPANLLKNRLAPGASGAGNANLDQLVDFQTAVDFCKHCGRQSGPADQHDRIERVCPGLQFAPPGR